MTKLSLQHLFPVPAWMEHRIESAPDDSLACVPMAVPEDMRTRQWACCMHLTPDTLHYIGPKGFVVGRDRLAIYLRNADGFYERHSHSYEAGPCDYLSAVVGAKKDDYLAFANA